MQTQSIKLLRTKNNQLLFFFYSNGNILVKQTSGQFFSQSEVIIENVSPNFSVCLSSDDTPFLLCSTHSGAIYFCKKSGLLWDKKLILESAAFNHTAIKFYIFMNAGRIHLIYSMPSEDLKQHFIMSLVCENGKWENPYKIDSFQPFPQCSFLIHKIEDNHIILYYKTRDTIINCREMLLAPVTLGTVTPLIQTNNYCTDISILTTTEKVHMSYILKGAFSSQLIYKNKFQSQICSPTVLYEGQRLESCISFKLKDKLWVMWMSNGQLFYVTSDNDGKNFSNPMKFQGNSCRQPLKIEYASKNKADFHCNEIYVNDESQNEILVLPDIYAEFFTGADGTKRKYNQNPEDAESIEKLKNKLDISETALKEANAQLMELTKELSQKNNDVSTVNVQWRSKLQELRESLRSTTLELETTRSENNSLKQELQKVLSENELLLNQVSENTILQAASEETDFSQ